VEDQLPQEPPATSEPAAVATTPPEAPPANKATPALKLEPIAGNNPVAPSEVIPSDAQSTQSAATAPLESISKSDAPQADPDPASPHDDLLDHGSPGEPVPLTIAQIEQRLGVSLARVEFTNVTLAQFAAFIGDMTGVPVVLDELSLTDAGKSRKTAIAVRLSNTTALAALRAASQQAGLTYAIEDGQILISAAMP